MKPAQISREVVGGQSTGTGPSLVLYSPGLRSFIRGLVPDIIHVHSETLWDRIRRPMYQRRLPIEPQGAEWFLSNLLVP